jgi:UDP-N-acetylmuramoyl-tripeptide--D-alanyl-D-alanine ligase
MEKIKVREIRKWVEGKIIAEGSEDIIYGISTDSRNINKGMLFIPLKGENFDGHDYIIDAINNGAVCVLTERGIEKNNNVNIIKVNDTKKALRDIAKNYRNLFDIPFIAITGSVGKTSTKDMISKVLERKYNVLKTLGNFNNEIGLPLTVFRLEKSHEVGITEMGMSGFGEIKRLVNIVIPETVVITNIGQSHIEKLGSKKNILKAKMEILKNLTSYNTVVLNGDDPMLWELKGKLPFKVIYVGMNNKKVDLLAENIKSLGEEGCFFTIDYKENNYDIKVTSPGVHNIYNALCAIVIGLNYNVQMDEIIKGISDFKSEKLRMNIINLNDTIIINDCYNASPDSMKAAIKVLEELGKSKRKIAILGDMLEMGDFSDSAHEYVGKLIFENKIDILITLGKKSKKIAEGAKNEGMDIDNIYSFDSIESINDFCKKYMNKKNDVILVKGSRGMKMENIVESIQHNLI